MMQEDLIAKLKREVDKTSWEMLRDHLKRGALFMVQGAELWEVGSAIARDDITSVKVWLDEGVLVKLESIPDGDDKSLSIDFLIVQPYVLIKVPH